jgi:glutathione S-transferase
MKLYYTPGACSLSPHIVAEEAGIPLELEKVDLREHKTQTGEDYYKINPKGYVPALELDDGSILTEGPAIVQYLADQKPASNLAPPHGTIGRYRLMEWLTFINSELHKSFSPLFGNGSDEAKNEAKTKIAKRFAYADSILAEYDYLLGNTFSIADAYLFVTTNWATAMEIELPTHLASFRKRVLARPKVQAALIAEGLPIPS